MAPQTVGYDPYAGEDEVQNQVSEACGAAERSKAYKGFLWPLCSGRRRRKRIRLGADTVGYAFIDCVLKMDIRDLASLRASLPSSPCGSWQGGEINKAAKGLFRLAQLTGWNSFNSFFSRFRGSSRFASGAWLVV